MVIYICFERLSWFDNIAPETLMRLNHGKESDFFGVGVVLFEMLRGYVNF